MLVASLLMLLGVCLFIICISFTSKTLKSFVFREFNKFLDIKEAWIWKTSTHKRTHKENRRRCFWWLMVMLSLLLPLAVIVGAYYKSHKSFAAFHTSHLSWKLKFGRQTTKKLTVDGERCATFCSSFFGLLVNGTLGGRIHGKNRILIWVRFALTETNINKPKLKDLQRYTCILIFSNFNLCWARHLHCTVIIWNDVVFAVHMHKLYINCVKMGTQKQWVKISISDDKYANFRLWRETEWNGGKCL